MYREEHTILIIPQKCEQKTKQDKQAKTLWAFTIWVLFATLCQYPLNGAQKWFLGDGKMVLKFNEC